MGWKVSTQVSVYFLLLQEFKVGRKELDTFFLLFKSVTKARITQFLDSDFVKGRAYAWIQFDYSPFHGNMVLLGLYQVCGFTMSGQTHSQQFSFPQEQDEERLAFISSSFFSKRGSPSPEFVFGFVIYVWGKKKDILLLSCPLLLVYSQICLVLVAGFLRFPP